MPGRKNISLRSINGYVPAKLTTGKRWYVEFYCYHPEKEKLHRCRVSVPPIKKASERRAYAKDMEEDLKNARTKHVFITHSGCTEEIIESVRTYLEELGHFEEILITRAGGVISSHCGPNPLGVPFMTE